MQWLLIADNSLIAADTVDAARAIALKSDEGDRSRHANANLTVSLMLRGFAIEYTDGSAFSFPCF